MSSETVQTIARLTPLADVLAMVDFHVKPVSPRNVDVAAAAGRKLATDVSAGMRPSAPLALRDGWALAADETLGADSIAPAELMRLPPRVEVGQAMPPDTDSVAPLDAVVVKNGQAKALAIINPGDGVLPAGGDCDPGIPLRRAGERLSATDVAAFTAAGLARLSMREPRVRVLPLRGTSIVTATARTLASDINGRGGAARVDDAGRDLGTVLAADSADFIVVIGGTGSGRGDLSVHALAREGEVLVHGMAIVPGATTAFGVVGVRPVLLLPGRLDAALAAWLMVGRRVLERLAGVLGRDNEPAESLSLAREVTSTLGLTEIVPVRRVAGNAEPLASKYLPFSALTRSDGWIAVPADSSGYSVGASVQVRPWP